MSTLANTQIRHTINNDAHHGTSEPSATVNSAVTASITARIDYVQRFSKQMVLVFDDKAETNAQLARQYLSSISQATNKQEVNVAFLAASSKINDIQMRCRIIEQLYGNTLFDPEQSLAVSILRLSKQSNDTVTIVVENAQALSLQVKYELCQLVNIAKKTQGKINVVLFALEQAAQNVALNRTIFDKKISIIEASTGQVIALNHARFKAKKNLFTNKSWQLISVTLLVSIISFFSWFSLTEHESLSLITKPVLAVTKFNVAVINEKPTVKNVLVKTPELELASITDVHSALLVIKQTTPNKTKVANTQDILQALVIAKPIRSIDSSEKTLPLNTQPKFPTATVQSLPDIATTEGNFTLNEQYFLNSTHGYVVQITAFSDLSILARFTNNNQGFKYYSYQKKLNGQKFTVMTSEIYSDKAQAKAALNSLPQTMSNLGSFLKAVSTIKREINTVNN